MKLATILLVATVLLSTTANSALIANADGQTVYDTTSNLTWLTDANLAATNTFGLATNVNLGTDSYGNQNYIDGYNGLTKGFMTWGAAQKWIDSMNASNYLGYNDWRLPTTKQPDISCANQESQGSSGYNCTGSEMGNLFYNELGGWSPNANQDLFRKASYSSSYWSSTMSESDIYAGWYFGFELFSYGYQDVAPGGAILNVMVVRDGQVAAVPVPAAAWLLGSGLLSLVSMIRRNAA